MNYYFSLREIMPDNAGLVYDELLFFIERNNAGLV